MRNVSTSRILNCRSRGEVSASTPWQNRFGKKIILYVCWDHKKIMYYSTQTGRNCVAIDNTFSILHRKGPNRTGTWTSDIVTWQCYLTTLFHPTKTLKWDLLLHPPHRQTYFLQIFIMTHGLAGLHSTNVAEMQNWLEERFLSKDTPCYRRGIYVIPEI